MDESSLTTDQERFWAGEFGDEYVSRNRGAHLVATNLALFARVLERTGPLDSVLELGANIGLNLQAIRLLLPDVALTGLELNPAAAKELRKIDCAVIEDSILNWSPGETYDLVFTKGVLIHLNPDALPDVYDKMRTASRRFVMIAEYYNPTAVTIPYRDHSDRLFKRDFAGEFLQAAPEFRLVDYGFRYHGGPFPADDITWFLLERTG